MFFLVLHSGGMVHFRIIVIQNSEGHIYNNVYICRRITNHKQKTKNGNETHLPFDPAARGIAVARAG